MTLKGKILFGNVIGTIMALLVVAMLFVPYMRFSWMEEEYGVDIEYYVQVSPVQLLLGAEVPVHFEGENELRDALKEWGATNEELKSINKRKIDLGALICGKESTSFIGFMIFALVFAVDLFVFKKWDQASRKPYSQATTDKLLEMGYDPTAAKQIDELILPKNILAKLGRYPSLLRAMTMFVPMLSTLISIPNPALETSVFGVIFGFIFFVGIDLSVRTFFLNKWFRYVSRELYKKGIFTAEALEIDAYGGWQGNVEQ